MDTCGGGGGLTLGVGRLERPVKGMMAVAARAVELKLVDLRLD